MKVVSESCVTWATSVPILVLLGLSVLELRPMYTTDVRQKHRLMPPPYGGVGIIITVNIMTYRLYTRYKAVRRLSQPEYSELFCPIWFSAAAVRWSRLWSWPPGRRARALSQSLLLSLPPVRSPRLKCSQMHTQQMAVTQMSIVVVTSEALGTCERRVYGRYSVMRRPGVEPATCWLKVQRPDHYTTEPNGLCVRVGLLVFMLAK